MSPIYIDAVGICAPGLLNWEQACPVLRDESPYLATDPGVYQPNLLPPNERRRATAAVRLAFRVAEDAMLGSPYPPSALATVFASSEGDTGILHRLCTALTEERRAVSPTDFHNSVHNASAGYWSIAAGAKLPSVSLSAFDASFSAGLVEATTLSLGDGIPVLLSAYDIVPPEPLLSARPRLTHAVGVALVLNTIPTPRSLARVSIHATNQLPTVMRHAALEALRLSNPAARALPLLQRLAMKKSGVVDLEGVGTQHWRITVEIL